MKYAFATVVVLLGLAAITVCLRQRDPRVPFMAVLGLVILVTVATTAILVAFDGQP